MDRPQANPLATDLPVRLRRELTAALGSKRHAIDGSDLDRYITWLHAALNRLGRGDDAQQVYDEWVLSHPRSARRAMASPSDGAA